MNSKTAKRLRKQAKQASKEQHLLFDVATNDYTVRAKGSGTSLQRKLYDGCTRYLYHQLKKEA